MKGLVQVRLKQNRLDTYYLRKKQVKKDSEGVQVDFYLPALPFYAVMWQASGKLQTEMYGNRLSYIRNIRIDGEYTIEVNGKHVNYVFQDGLSLCEGDGVNLYVSKDSEPDYRIILIKPYKPLYMEVEKL